MDAYIKQMEMIMQSDQFKQEAKGTSNIPLNKDQLMQCFQMYVNNQQQSKSSENQIERIKCNNEMQSDDLYIEKEEPVDPRKTPSTSHQEKLNEINNFDDIPIHPKKVDFNKLVEQELAKGEYQGSDNPNQVRFEYKKKPKYIDKYKVSEPTDSKKYKYYSDNFKSKQGNDDYQIDNYQSAIGKNKHDEDQYHKRAKSGNSKRVAPVMPQKKREMFSRGYNNVKANQGPVQKVKNENYNTQPLGKDNNNKKEIESLWSEYQQGNNDKEFLEFNTTKQVRSLMDSNKNKNNNSNYPSNKNIVTTSTESLKGNKKNVSGTNNKNNITNSNQMMPMDDDEFNEQVNRILNQKIPSGILSQSNNNNHQFNQYNQYQNHQIEDEDEDEDKDNHSFNKHNNMDDYYHKQNMNEQFSARNNNLLNNKQEDESEDNDAQEEDREIYQMYSDQLLKKETESKLNPQPIQQKQIIVPEQSKIINKYFKTPINKKSIPSSSSQQISNNNPQQGIINPKSQEVVHSLVNDKIEELNSNIDKLKKENGKVSELKSEYERLTKRLRLDIDDYAKKRENERIEFEKFKEEEMKKIERERKIHLKNTKLLQNLPSKKEREEIDNLKEQVMKLQEEMKLKDQRNKLAMDRIKKQLEESQRKNEELQKEIKVYEELRLKNINKVPFKKQNTTIASNINNSNLNSNSMINDNDNNELGTKNAKSSKNLSVKMQPEKVLSSQLNNRNKPNQNQNQKEVLSQDNRPSNKTPSNTTNVSANTNAIKKNQNQKEVEMLNEYKSANIDRKKISQQYDDCSEEYGEQEGYDDNNNNKDNYNSQSNNNKDDNIDKDYEDEEIDENNQGNNNNVIEGSNETFEMVFYDKYHNSQMANNLKLIKQDVTPDGKIIKVYENNKREVIFPSGLRKEIFSDGYQISYFHNHDIKQLYPDGKEVYLFSENNTVHTKLPNGVQVFRFNNGQIEKNFPDGTKIVNYTEGTIRNIYNDGYEEIFFNDGSLQKIHKGGIVTMEYRDGIKDTIYPNGSKMKEYPDGKVIKTNTDGNTQSYYKS